MGAFNDKSVGLLLIEVTDTRLSKQHYTYDRFILLQAVKSLYSTSELNKNDIFTQRKDTVNPLVKNNMVMLFHSSFRMTSIVFIYVDPTSLF